MQKRLPHSFQAYLAHRDRTALGAGEGLSWRGFWSGACLSLLLATGAPYADTAMRATFMAWDFNTPGAIFIFLVLVGLLNTLFKLGSRSTATAAVLATVALAGYLYYWPRFDFAAPGWIGATFLTACALINLPLTLRGSGLALGRADLILVYFMLLIVSALCSMGMSEQLLPIIAAAFYYASPQNKWAAEIFPHFPRYRIVVDDNGENRAFFEGLEGNGAIPYQAWIEPLIWWGLFLLALYTAMVAIAVITRRQWMERERLAYPIAQVGLAIIEGEKRGQLVNDFFKQRALWAGCAIPMFIGSLNALYHYFPSVPRINLLWNMSFLQHQSLQLRVSFVMVGFSYLISTSISAGLWIFQLLAKVESETLRLVGIQSQQRFVYGIADQPYLAYQGGGALIALVLVGLWTGRGHFKNVLAKALGRAPQVDDSDEIMSYRAAVIMLATSVVVMTGWLWLMGVALWVAVVFLVLALLIFIGITRVVAEAGLAAVRSPMIAPDLMIQGLGSTLVGASGVLNFSLAYIWCADIRIFVLGLCANGLKLIDQLDLGSRRRVLWGFFLALFIGSVGSCWIVLHMAYKHGGINLVGWFFKGGPQVVYGNVLRNLEPSGVAWDGLGFFFGGGAAMLAMMWARHRFLWWPLHPLGFPVAANHLMNKVWFSIFLAWLIKVVVLRWGGPAHYKKSVVFFLGLIMGEALCNGLWIVIDYFTGKMGNIVFILG
ncbi:MAG: hypothetical protein GKR89_33080 [Candidatus Latescibacteria bacterium]|nr:hypothetical protein [Candidatus Latescibacterota bacterium]